MSDSINPPRNPNGNSLAVDYMTTVYTGKSTKFHDFINLLKARREMNDTRIKDTLDEAMLGIFNTSTDRDLLLVEILEGVPDKDEKLYVVSIYRRVVTGVTSNRSHHGCAILA